MRFRRLPLMLGLVLIASGFGTAAYTVFALFYSGQTVAERNLESVVASTVKGGTTLRGRSEADSVKIPVSADMAPVRIIAEGRIGALPGVSTHRANFLGHVQSLHSGGRPGQESVSTIQLSSEKGDRTGSERHDLLEPPADWKDAEMLRIWISPATEADKRYRPSFSVRLMRNVWPFHKVWIAWIFAGPLLGFFVLHFSRLPVCNDIPRKRKLP